MSKPVALVAPAKKPFDNCYWIKPGQLLAGEYPAGDSKRATTQRVRNLIDAGIRTFIDLTQPGEMPEYAGLLPARSKAQHLRFAIHDHDVPQSAAHMAGILDAIEAALAHNGGVYVHCRAGIGRTGTVIGCYLVRAGYTNETALETLNELWQQCGRARNWPNIPETAEQRTYVRSWREASKKTQPATSRAQPNPMERFEGCLLGLAVGDACGMKAQVNASGIWGSDTAMTWCLADSLLEKGSCDPEDQMQRYLRWHRQGEYSSGVAVPTPKEVQRALASWQWNRKPLAGSHDPANLDPHSLARTAAVALRYAHDPAKALQIAAEASRTTLQSPVVLDACRLYAALLASALSGASKDDLLKAQTPAFAALREYELKAPVAGLLNNGGRMARPKKNQADVLTILSGAWRAFADSSSFLAGLQAVVQTSPLPATSGALYGALAGAHYGAGALPSDDRRQLVQAAALSKLVIGLHTAASKH